MNTQLGMQSLCDLTDPTHLISLCSPIFTSVKLCPAPSRPSCNASSSRKSFRNPQPHPKLRVTFPLCTELTLDRVCVFVELMSGNVCVCIYMHVCMRRGCGGEEGRFVRLCDWVLGGERVIGRVRTCLWQRV